jgi:antitoxin component of MazEF toxin-antitoxin module
MITKIQKRGNSQGLRTPVVKPLRRVRGGHDLRALVGRISKKYKPKELDWGPTVGREVW